MGAVNLARLPGLWPVAACGVRLAPPPGLALRLLNRQGDEPFAEILELPVVRDLGLDPLHVLRLDGQVLRAHVAEREILRDVMADGLRRFEEALQAMAGQAGSGGSPSGARRPASGATGGTWTTARRGRRACPWEAARWSRSAHRTRTASSGVGSSGQRAASRLFSKLTSGTQTTRSRTFTATPARSERLGSSE